MEYNPINLHGRFSHLTGRNEVHQHKSKDDHIAVSVPNHKPVITGGSGGLSSEDHFLCQRFVIFERDDKGYGLTVSGDNPVFVQSVKEDGPAYLAGVQKGDRIVKVNEVLVTQCNHTEVVRLIKANAFVALTLLGKSPTKLPTAQPTDTNGRVGGKPPPTMAPPITSPQPADASQQQSFSDNRLQTMNIMREKEMQNIFQLTKEFQVNPTEKLQADLDAALKRVKQLQEQIFVLSFRRNQATTVGQTSPGTAARSPLSDRPLPPLPIDVAMAPGRVSRKNSGTSNHNRQLSTPEPLHIAAALSLPTDGAVHNRSLSDLLSARSDSLTNNSLPPSGVRRPSEARPRTFSTGDSSNHRISAAPSGLGQLMNPGERQPNPGSYPGLSAARGRQLDILTMEDTSQAQAAVDANQRPFMHYLTLQRHLPHLSVFLHYLISSSDPSSLLFHFLSEYYTKGSTKEMQRWAYELHSTFLVPGAPLEIECVKHFPALVSHVDDILDKIEKAEESQLRELFTTVRNRALDTVKAQLAEFQQKKVLGLGTMFGPSEAELDEADKSTDRTKDMVGEILGKILESISGASQEEPENRSDRQAAIGCAVGSVMKLTSVKLKEKDGMTLLDRWPLFLQKDKNKFRLKDKTKKAISVAGHQFSQVTCTTVASCNQCKDILWGVAPQGYQCAFCDYIAHRGCAKNVEETCIGKKTTRTGFPSAMEDFFSFRKRSNQNPAAIANAKRLHEDREDSASPSLTDSLDGGLRRPDSSLARQLAEGKSPDRSDTPQSSPSISRSESLRNNRRAHGMAASRKKSDPTHLDRDESESTEYPGQRKLTGTSESSSGSSPSLRSSESPMASTEAMDVVTDGDSDFEADADSMPSWQSYLPSPEIFEKLDSRNRKRQDVIAELFHTERTHVRNLKVLRLIFYGPMTRDNLLPPELASQVFANLDEMIMMHSQLNKAMREMRKSKSLIGKIGDLLLSRFDGDPGYQFKMAAAAFCRNQSSGLEALKLRQKKDQKLAAFLAEAESNPLCRRLQLKDLLPAGMQRLTKYPLLLTSLLKYTSTEQDEDKEYEKVFVALNSSREILEFVNQAVKESGNQNRLRDLQDKIDMAPFRKTQTKLGLDHKHIDLSDYRLLSDGDLTWRYNKQKTIDLRLILLNKYLLIVTRQDDKLILKFHNNPQGNSGPDKRTSAQYESSRHWTPVLSLEQLTVKDVANDTRAFFLYWQGPNGAHMYELVASSPNEQKLWVREIRSAIEGLSGCVDIMSAFPQTATVSVTSSSSATSTDGESPDNDTVEEDEAEDGQTTQGEKRGLEGYRESKRRRSMGVLTSPSAVVVTHMEVMDAELILTPFEQLRRRDKQLEEAIIDKKRLVSSILGISEETTMSREATPTKENPTEPKELVFQAMQQCNHLTELVTDVWATSNSDIFQQMQPESQTSEPTNGRRSSSAQTKISVPMLDAYQLEEIAVTLNRQLASLMSAVCVRDDENERLRKELKHAKEQVKILRTETRSPSPGFTLARPTTFGNLSNSLDSSTKSPSEANTSDMSSVENRENEAV